MIKAATKKIVVVGNGMVGWKFCALLRQSDISANFEITVFGEEPRAAYDRVHLTAYFETRSADKLMMCPDNWYADNDIDLFLGDKIISIDRENRVVTSESGKQVEYDRLILATGSDAFVPPVDGIDKEGVFVYRTIEDLDKIIAYAKNCKTAAVLGGGLLGLEAARAAMDLGLDTEVIEFAQRLMPRQLDDKGAACLKQLIEAQGLGIQLNRATATIDGDGAVDKLTFTTGDSLDIDMLIVSAGIRPRDEVAKACGLEVGPRGGVVVNDSLQTSDACIYAIGEVALYNQMIYGLVAPGYTMAQVVVDQLAGVASSFTGADMSTKLKLIGTDVASFGNAFPSEGTFDTVELDEIASKGIYKKLFYSKDGTTLLGGILVGDATEYATLLMLYQNGGAIPDNPYDLIDPEKTGDSSGILAMDDDTKICTCENVSKGDIMDAIAGGAMTPSDIKVCTRAGAGCGGCMPMVTQLLHAKLKADGIEVNEDICEHFKYKRTELFDLVKQDGVKTYDELLGRHGSGLGCEICKPAVGSILASLWNEPVNDHASLQDTNDAFLANIQKNGSYSIIPRMSGGEVTAEKMIALGQIAKKYNLYVKLTGGQRVAMLGAKVEQLPIIWRELLDAGFESGQAYGKSLRTVKSCVGQSWCRFGVNDSTDLAVTIEERYKGLRSPHKLKSAVSGCVRECAEARSKDFGIIATEKGWDLFVCGNGGMTPQHGILLASDLSKEQVLLYIDRFLMYYIRTADRLTRTSVWFNNLEGGIEHLKDVIIKDSLGICDELEAAMRHHIDTYECDWARALKNDEYLTRFKPFVNTEDTDKTINFETVRKQIQPL